MGTELTVWVSSLEQPSWPIKDDPRRFFVHTRNGFTEKFTFDDVRCMVIMGFIQYDGSNEHYHYFIPVEERLRPL